MCTCVFVMPGIVATGMPPSRKRAGRSFAVRPTYYFDSDIFVYSGDELLKAPDEEEPIDAENRKECRRFGEDMTLQGKKAININGLGSFARFYWVVRVSDESDVFTLRSAEVLPVHSHKKAAQQRTAGRLLDDGLNVESVC